MRRVQVIWRRWRATMRERRHLNALAKLMGAVLLMGWLIGLLSGPFDLDSRLLWAQGAGRIELEIRPRGIEGGNVEKPLPQGILEKVRSALPSGARVEQYLFVKLEEGAVIVGIAPLNAPFRTPMETFRPRFTAGRGFKSEDAGQAVAVIGQRYAETHKTVFGYKISEMVYPGHTPRVPLTEGRTVEVVGIFESGSADGDNQLVMPLKAVQQLLKRPGQLHRIFVPAKSAAEAEQLKKALERALGSDVEVQIRK